MQNLDVCSEHYSTKLAIRALKVYSGYKKGPKSYFLIRNELGTCEELFCLLWPELDDLRTRAIEVKKKTAAHFLNCLINLRRVLFQDLAYMKIKGNDHWLFGEYPFNTDQFASYVEDAKKNYENAQNQDAMNENTIDLDRINNLIRLEHDNLTKKIEKLLRK